MIDCFAEDVEDVCEGEAGKVVEEEEGAADGYGTCGN